MPPFEKSKTENKVKMPDMTRLRETSEQYSVIVFFTFIFYFRFWSRIATSHKKSKQKKLFKRCTNNLSKSILGLNLNIFSNEVTT